MIEKFVGLTQSPGWTIGVGFVVFALGYWQAVENFHNHSSGIYIPIALLGGGIAVWASRFLPD